jgi:hypothetical protein
MRFSNVLGGFAAAALALNGPSPAAAAIDNPVTLGGIAGIGSGGAVSITLTADVPAGHMIYVPAISASSSSALNSVSDTVNGTYSLTTVRNFSGTLFRGAYVVTNVLTPATTVITVTWNNNSGTKLAQAFDVGGIASPTASAFDQTGLGNVSPGATNNPNISGITPTNAESIIFVTTLLDTTGNVGWTEDSTDGYTPAQANPADAPSANFETMRVAWRIVNSTATTAYSATNGNNITWITNYEIFKGAGGVTPTPHGKMLKGCCE